MPGMSFESIVTLIAYFAILTILIGAGIYVSGLFRGKSLQKEQTTEELVKYFQELHSQGKLSDEEFRIIKKQLSLLIVEEHKSAREQVGTHRGVIVPSIDPAVFLARAAKEGILLKENQDDTQVSGGREEGNTEDTVVDRSLTDRH